jgi:hypothetical protein
VKARIWTRDLGLWYHVKVHALATWTKSPNWWKGLVQSTYTLQQYIGQSDSKVVEFENLDVARISWRSKLVQNHTQIYTTEYQSEQSAHRFSTLYIKWYWLILNQNWSREDHNTSYRRKLFPRKFGASENQVLHCKSMCFMQTTFFCICFLRSELLLMWSRNNTAVQPSACIIFL